MTIAQYEERTTNALATAQDAAVTRLSEWAQSADAAYQVAVRLSDSAFVPQQFRGKPVETTAAILAGLEVGLSPMQAIRSFDIIGGTAAPRAITLRALVQSRGHEMVLVESTTTRCKMKGRRRDSQEWQGVTWTIERAQGLGLTSKDNWRKQPAAMLVARATSELARLVASDAILGIGYSSEEIADGGAYEQQVAADVVAEQPEQGSRTMSRRPRAVAVEPEPEPEPEPVSESPLLNTSSKLAKALYATVGEAGIPKGQMHGFLSSALGRDVGSSKELTEDECREILDNFDALLASFMADGADQ